MINIFFSFIISYLVIYSSLRASIGLILTALSAGIKPINVPSVIIVINAPETIVIGTVGFVNGKSSKPDVPILIINKRKAPTIIPIIPAIMVRKTDSSTI